MIQTSTSAGREIHSNLGRQGRIYSFILSIHIHGHVLCQHILLGASGTLSPSDLVMHGRVS